MATTATRKGVGTRKGKSALPSGASKFRAYQAKKDGVALIGKDGALVGDKAVHRSVLEGANEVMAKYGGGLTHSAPVDLTATETINYNTLGTGVRREYAPGMKPELADALIPGNFGLRSEATGGQLRASEALLATTAQAWHMKSPLEPPALAMTQSRRPVNRWTARIMWAVVGALVFINAIGVWYAIERWVGE